MATRISWSGIYVVSVTPFESNLSLDEQATRNLMEAFVSEGVDGIVLAGSTGEWFSMTEEEKLALFRVAADQVKGRVKLIAGASSMNTRDAVTSAKAAKELGMDGVLLLPPPYVLPNEVELLAFVQAIDNVGIPIMLYNNPGRTGINLDAKWLRKLTRFKNVVALKESAKDLGQVAETLKEFSGELAIFTGMEPYVVPFMQRGAAGVVAMAPNVLGARAVEFFRAAQRGDWQAVTSAQGAIDDLYAQMYGMGVNPYVVQKEAMALLGRPGGVPRPPLLGLNEAQRASLRAALTRMTAKS